MKQKNNYITRQQNRDRVLQQATRQTYEQFMTDTLLLTLNDPDVMGKDVFGYKRLKKVLEAWGKTYDLYFEAMTRGAEADYKREKMDAAIKRIVGDSGDFLPFEKRYEYLPEITYGGKKK